MSKQTIRFRDQKGPKVEISVETDEFMDAAMSITMQVNGCGKSVSTEQFVQNLKNMKNKNEHN